ncbi:MAG: penicillin amidase [Bradymonadia bacterium]|jgi:penicillin amidase
MSTSRREIVPFVEVEYEMTPFDAEAETRTLLFVPHHGPVLSVDEESGTAISLIWTGNRVTTDGNFLTELMAASTVDEGRQAATNVTSIGQNWVMIDTEGSIGWFPYNQVPIREWASMDNPTFLPLPGDGSAEWDGILPYEDLPQAYNPEAGWIATANNDMTGALMDGDPYNESSTPLQVYSATGYRAFRIHELLEAQLGAHDPQTMLDTVGDVTSAVGQDLAPLFIGLTIGETPLSDAAQLLSDTLDGWQGTCPTGLDGIDASGPASSDGSLVAEAAGCTAFHVMFGQLYDGVFADEVAAAGVERRPSRTTLIRLLLSPETLENGESYWDDVSTEIIETPQDIGVAAADAAGAWLTAELGPEPSDWLWGRVHTLTLRADLFNSFGIPTFNNGPFANDGGLYTVDVANPGDMVGHNYTQSAGASTRFVCRAPATGVRCTVQLPGGQRHYRDSENYDDLFRRYLLNQEVDLGFDIVEAAANAASSVTFAPTE